MTRTASVLFLCLFPVVLIAAEADPLFQAKTPLDLSLNAPFELIDRERDKDKEYEGTLSYVDESGQIVVLDAEYSVRGNWRLQKKNCRYSQLWVNLKRGQVPGTLFENQNRLKLVVQCRPAQRYQDLILKEQMAYEIFEQFSDLHFDTRLVNATYQDSEDTDESRTHSAFFIEHQNRLAERFDLQGVDENSVSYSDLDSSQASLTALFMFLVGNTDFSLTAAPEGESCCHNAKLLQAPDGAYFAVPYDFDSSGFVDAPYAAPPLPTFGISSNRSRLHRGYCVHKDTLPASVELALSKRDAILALFDVAGLENRQGRRAREFLVEFFEILGDPRDLTRDVLEECRG